MSNVIEFLERMGQDAHLRHATNSTIESVLSSLHIDSAAQQAIVDRNQEKLEALLGAETNVCCAIFSDDEINDARSEGRAHSRARR